MITTNDYKQAYEELKLILDLSFDQITIADGNGIFTKISKTCEDFFGVAEDEIIGKSAFELEEKGIFSISATAEVLRNKSKITLIQTTKANRVLRVTGIPVFDENNQIVKIVNISKDITENQMLKSEISEVQSELKWFYNELNKRQGVHDVEIVEKSKKIKKIVEMIEHISDLDNTVLLLGETGVGKGYIAKYIHEKSNRRNEPFITINCAAIPEHLLESELFGYESGAFSGALRGGKKGLFELAGSGTIFLDEIGDMPLNLQVKLLHVLDQKKVVRVGGERPYEVKGRIIAATNKMLYECVDSGLFREDLYYRLNVLPILIPPLRERKEDIPIISERFLNIFNKKYGFNKYISQFGYALLSHYDFPGNVRELENLIERLVITTQSECIDEEDIREIISQKDIISYEQKELFIPLKESVEELEKRIISQAYSKYKNMRDVAKVLNVDHTTISKKMKKYKIDIHS